MLHAVIMAGGAGTRFWPASRVNRPKQLLNLTGSQSMIQATVQRLGDLVTNDRLLVVTNEKLVEPIRQQLPDLPPASILGEPCKRDTAPCVGLAAAILVASDPDATMLVMPADHVIQQADEFRRAISFGHELLQEDPRRIITFGIRPTYPAEIFGYIERADTLASNVEPAGRTIATYRVRQFREKPSADVAQQYLAAGNFYWNSGIFPVASSNDIERIEEIRAGDLPAHCPDCTVRWRTGLCRRLGMRIRGHPGKINRLCSDGTV
jgi:mannose-1-phosphate guanylyltransferase